MNVNAKSAASDIIILNWSCQSCGENTLEIFSEEGAAERRSRALWKLERAHKLVCKCNGPISACERCGACCAYDGWIVAAAPNRHVKRGHLYDFDGKEGFLRMIKKPWSRDYQVCSLLLQGVGCSIHNAKGQPPACVRFNCKHPHKEGSLQHAVMKQFAKFRQEWLATGMAAVMRGEKNS